MENNTVKISSLNHFSFPVIPNGQLVNVIQIIPNQIVTKACRYPAEEIEKHDIARIQVLERYGKNGHISYGLVEGTGLIRGAFASTYAHDSHNMVVLGVNDADMRYAAEVLASVGGGAAVVENGKVLSLFELAVGGVCSKKSAPEVQEECLQLKQASKKLGITLADPMLTISFLSLPVIPEIKLTEAGLFDVRSFSFIPLWDNK